jgi:regulator of sirC expression with transglutaminase-like and TPR domain
VKPVRHAAWENQLFFGRLRTTGKVLFLMVAAVFVLGFVFLGIGSGSTGIGTILQNWFSGSSASGSSLSALQKQTVAHPKSASAWLAYANKLQQDNKLDEAAQALTTYTTLKPSDTDQLRTLAAIYLRRATDWQTLYSASLTRQQALSPSQLLNPVSTSPLGKAVASISSPLATSVASQASTATNNEYSQFASDLSQYLSTWKKIAKLTPDDASTQLSLAQAAQDAADSATAIAAYKAFLKLAPTDAQAPAARKALKQLEAQAAKTAKKSATTAKK